MRRPSAWHGGHSGRAKTASTGTAGCGSFAATVSVVFRPLPPIAAGTGDIITRYLYRLSETARTRKVKFTGELVETCVLVMLAGVGESGIGVSGLFTDKKLGRRAAPDFEQYVESRYFKLFQKAILFVLTDEALWEKDQDKGDRCVE